MSTPQSLDLPGDVRVAEPEALAPTELGFAAVLRDRTQAVHREAERTGFMADLLRGRARREGYGIFLRNFVPVYEALEDALARHHDPLIAPFADPAIRRLPRLCADVAAIVGPNWAQIEPLPEAKAYAAAIGAAAADGPARLVAHAYARYLGDLSGGQILRPLLARNLGLTDSELGFCDFPDIPDVAIPKAAMRRALDTIPRESAEADAAVNEALAAFRHNIDLSLAVSRAA